MTEFHIEASGTVYLRGKNMTVETQFQGVNVMDGIIDFVGILPDDDYGTISLTVSTDDIESMKYDNAHRIVVIEAPRATVWEERNEETNPHDHSYFAARCESEDVNRILMENYEQHLSEAPDPFENGYAEED